MAKTGSEEMDEQEKCEVCKGTGRNADGGHCIPCHGVGITCEVCKEANELYSDAPGLNAMLSCEVCKEANEPDEPINRARIATHLGIGKNESWSIDVIGGEIEIDSKKNTCHITIHMDDSKNKIKLVLKRMGIGMNEIWNDWEKGKVSK